MNKYLRFSLRFLPALLCMVCIFCFSAQSASQSSETSGTLIHEFLLRTIPGFAEQTVQEQKVTVESMQFFVRKGAHFSIYAILAVLMFPAFIQLFSSSFFAASVSFISSFLYAVSDEIHQSFVPGRSCEFRDVFIDSCGALTGLVFLLLLRHFLQKIRKKCDH